ncbi:MAG TPA: DUF378 domain-containing protein [Patescibacteria group bacterium]|jgi:hypothetical protein|nr:DUF378 domain-containing protein [Patescibacteria group bacterium]
MVTFILMAVGALNWGVFAVSGWEIGSLFGGMTATVSKVIYILVGLSAVYEIAMHGKHCRMCKPDGSMPGGMSGMPQ